jgi:hypothetical protein
MNFGTAKRVKEGNEGWAREGSLSGKKLYAPGVAESRFFTKR